MFSKLYSLNFIIIVLLLSIQIILAETEETVIEIDQPKFSEKGLDQKSYEIKAKKGFRTQSNLKLYEVEGKFKTENGVWIYMIADKGEYAQSEDRIKLSENIKFYTEQGETIQSQHALFKIKEDIIIFEKNVIHENIETKITSEYSVITNNFNTFLYEGNVRTEIIK